MSAAASDAGSSAGKLELQLKRGCGEVTQRKDEGEIYECHQGISYHGKEFSNKLSNAFKFNESFRSSFYSGYKGIAVVMAMNSYSLSRNVVEDDTEGNSASNMVIANTHTDLMHSVMMHSGGDIQWEEARLEGHVPTRQATEDDVAGYVGPNVVFATMMQSGGDAKFQGEEARLEGLVHIAGAGAVAEMVGSNSHVETFRDGYYLAYGEDSDASGIGAASSASIFIRERVLI